MKIYILDPFFPSGVEYAEQRAEVVRWDDPKVKNWHEDADGIMVRGSKIRADDIARVKKLKVISKQGVGIENVDVAAATARGISVYRTPGINKEAVAEHALGLALSVVRRIAEFDRQVRSSDKVERTHFLGLESWGKTVGVVGMGDIGTRIARKWHAAFDAKIIAYDPYVDASRWPDIPHSRAKSLQELLSQVDILTLHLPFTDESNGMINAAALALMKPTAVVINTSRGGIVDEKALYQAVSSGKLFGAGLDVFDIEPPTTENPLTKLPTVVLTPHAAGGTYETQVRSSLLVAEQLFEALAGGQPLGRVA
jgi:D-3-phosphoglycerate dehydrogenase